MFNWSLLKIKNIYKIKKLKYTNKNVKMQYGVLGLKLLENCTFQNSQIKSFYRYLHKNIKQYEKDFQIKMNLLLLNNDKRLLSIVNFKKLNLKRISFIVIPNLSVTKKPLTVRMGKGKGSKFTNVSYVKKGSILFNLSLLKIAKKKKIKKKYKNKKFNKLKKLNKNLFLIKYKFFYKMLKKKNFYINLVNVLNLKKFVIKFKKMIFRLFIIFKRLFFIYKYWKIKKLKKLKKRRKKKVLSILNIDLNFFQFIDLFFKIIDRKLIMKLFDFKFNMLKKKKIIKENIYKIYYYENFFYKYNNINYIDNDINFFNYLLELMVQLKKKISIKTKIIKYYL